MEPRSVRSAVLSGARKERLASHAAAALCGAEDFAEAQLRKAFGKQGFHLAADASAFGEARTAWRMLGG
jgi:hypothetical protein